MTPKLELHEARWYHRQEGERVHCHLCAHHCVIADGKLGICQVRQNQGGTLYSLVYGRTIAQHVDPIEKKPLFHYYPGSTAFSIATPGCNFRCTFCQNADISQMPREQHLIMGEEVTPAQIVRTAQRAGCRSIAYTYTEPTVFSEYALDVAVEAHAAGLGNVYVTNGYMTQTLLDDLHPYLDAANVDLKAFRDEFYREMCGARLGPVLDSLRALKRLGVWVEVTTLLIPGANDDPGELRDLAGFIASDLGPETPWHVSRFHPTYKLTDRPPTPPATIELAASIGREAGLHYVYMGNLPGHGETTRCHNCGQAVIERYGFSIQANRLLAGKCPQCQTPAAGRGL
jgi:pyruvate formate lyase activating enzyme